MMVLLAFLRKNVGKPPFTLGNKPWKKIG